MPMCVSLMGDGVRLARMTETPTLHLTVGLPGVGKTTLARRIAHEDNAVRFSPDEWMIPLFGTNAYPTPTASETSLKVACCGPRTRCSASVALSSSTSGAGQRQSGGPYVPSRNMRADVSACTSSTCRRRNDVPAQRLAGRGTRAPTFEMSPGDHDRFLGVFEAPTEAEIAAKHLPAPPTGHRSWLAWAADRWPSLPDFTNERV